MRKYFALVLAIIGWTVAIPGNLLWEIAGWVHTGGTYRVRLVQKLPPMPEGIRGDGFVMIKYVADRY